MVVDETTPVVVHAATGGRAAARDYYELHAVPCNRCEMRLVTAERETCRHCTAAAQIALDKARLAWWAFTALVVLVAVNWLCARLGWDLDVFTVSGVLTALIVLPLEKKFVEIYRSLHQ